MSPKRVKAVAKRKFSSKEIKRRADCPIKADKADAGLQFIYNILNRFKCRLSM